MRRWRIQATVTMPRFIHGGPDGSFPQTLKSVNVYPEQRLIVRGDMEVWLKCKEAISQLEGSYSHLDLEGEVEESHSDPGKAPYFLEAHVHADTGIEAVDLVINWMELITDFLSFQLQYPVRIVHLIVCSPSQTIEHQADVVTFSGKPYHRILKDAVYVFCEPSYLSFDASRIRSDVPEDVRAALRWFNKGLVASAVLDKFAFYWIAFEILATGWPWDDEAPARRYLECPRCRKPIIKCPICDQTTEVRPGVADRVRRLGDHLDRDDELMECLWATRQMFHGQIRFDDSKVTEGLPQQTQQLKALVIDAMKIRLGIPSATSPIGRPMVPITSSTAAIEFTIQQGENHNRNCCG